MQSLQFLYLDLDLNNLGNNESNLKYLGDGLKYLSNSLRTLKLNLHSNNLGGNMKYIGGWFKTLDNLQYLVIKLSFNDLGIKVEDMK